MPAALLQQRSRGEAPQDARPAGRPRPRSAPLTPPLPLAPPPLDGAATHPEPGLPPKPLPPHLQHAVHQALSSLQAQRLLYPQQCAAAERAGEGARREAESHVAAALGGSFDYAAAAAELQEARRSAQQLLQQHKGGAAPAGAAAPAPAAALCLPPDSNEDEALWSSFEAFSAAVAAEVDRRIAAARLRPVSPAKRPQERRRPTAAAAAQPAAMAAAISRQPLSSLQQASALAPPAAERKRVRSPPAGAAAAAAGQSNSSRSRDSGRARPAVPLAAAQAASGLPSSKRQKPHVAFGTRCDAPRPPGGPPGAKPVRLDAAAAPTPPQLPPAHPAPASPSKRGGRATVAGVAAAGPAPTAGPAPRADLLRSVAAAFAGGSSTGGGSGARACTPGQQEKPAPQRAQAPAAAAAEPGSDDGIAPGQMGRMLADLTAALDCLHLPPAVQPGPAAGEEGSSGLHAVLQQHGIDAAAAQDASCLLQAVLDRMDAIAARPQQQQQQQQQQQPGECCAPPEGGVYSPVTAPASPTAALPAGLSPAADQLCRQLTRLLEASDAELQDVQREVAAAQQAETVAERLNAAAIQAAVAGAEAAAATSAAAACSACHPHPADAGDAVQREVLLASPAPLLPGAAACGRPASATWASGWRPGSAPPAAELEPESGCARADGAAAAPRQPASRACSTALSCEPAPADAAEPGAAVASSVGAAPAAGWPVQWSVAAPALGVPLLPPPLGQLQWLVPCAPAGCGWQPVAVQPPVLGVPVQQVQPPQQSEAEHQQRQVQGSGAGKSNGQEGSEQARREPGDEQLPDSPLAAAASSSGSERGREATAAEPADGEAAKSRNASPAEQAGEQGKQQQQGLLEEDAGWATARCQEGEALQAAGEEAGACDTAVLAMGACPAAVPGNGAAEAEQQAEGEAGSQAAAVDEPQQPWADPPAGPGADAASAELEAAGSQRVGTTAASCPHEPPPQPPPLRPAPPPYNPLKAATERAAAARTGEEASGWRRLQQQADELALWQEYAAGMDLEAPEQEAEGRLVLMPSESLLAERPSQAAALPAPDGMPSRGAFQQRAGNYAEAPPALRRLWRPSQACQAALSPELPPPSPGAQPSLLAAEPSTLASSSFLSTSSASGGSSTPAGSSLLSAEDSSSCPQTGSSLSSLGVGARHKARALRYRLLRRRLEAAAGARLSMLDELPPLADCPSESSAPSPLTAGSPAAESSRPSSGTLSEPSSAVAAAAAHRAAEQRTLPAAGVHDGWQDEQQAQWMQRHEERQALCCEPQQARAPAVQPAQATPCAAPPLCGLADHLSDATPSSGCASLDSAPAMEAAAVSTGRRRLLSGSSCSTLQEVQAA